MKTSFNTPENNDLLSRSASKLTYLSDNDVAQIATFNKLTDYLASISKPGSLPNRKQVHPSRFKELLPNLYILDVVWEKNEPVDFILRLMGTNVAHFYGEHSGKSIHTMENKEATNRIETCARKAITERCNIAVRVAALSSTEQHLKVSVLYCPLAKSDQVINQIIGLVEVRSGLADTP